MTLAAVFGRTEGVVRVAVGAPGCGACKTVVTATALPVFEDVARLALFALVLAVRAATDRVAGPTDAVFKDVPNVTALTRRLAANQTAR